MEFDDFSHRSALQVYETSQTGQLNVGCIDHDLKKVIILDRLSDEANCTNFASIKSWDTDFRNLSIRNKFLFIQVYKKYMLNSFETERV